jgi:ribosomal protein S18 acetylase RimI-like enzyme
LVAEDADGRVVGAVGYDRMPGTDGKVGRARQVSVSPQARGRGIGRALVEEVMARLRAEGVTEMAERTADYMAGAQALYLSLGFRRAPERDETQDDGPDLMGFHRHL